MDINACQANYRYDKGIRNNMNMFSIRGQRGSSNGDVGANGTVCSYWHGKTQFYFLTELEALNYLKSGCL